ncbi:MAG: sensor histidine kinase protein [Gemmatimonadales bacterium]|nr:sensor histidine kinase protein [Gemmatimonadales bacterium]
MKTPTATGLTHWVRGAEAKILHPRRVNIGPRLVLGFGLIIVAMLAADAVVLWQFQAVRAQSERLSDIDQARIAVLRVHTGLLAFHDRLDALADSEDAAGLTTEVEPLRNAALEQISRATAAVSRLPGQLQQDPTILPTLRVVQGTLRSQLEAITPLALAGDWRAVHLRLANQIRPLESVTSTLVDRVDQEVSAVQVETALNLQRVQRRVFLIVPLTAVLTLLIAAAMGLAITRSITQPLERLVRGSKALALGDFDHQVAISGDDELARLGHAFNDAAQRLRDLYATIQTREDFLRLVINTIPGMVWSGLPDGSFDFINEPWLTYLGCSWEELTARGGLRSVVHPDDVLAADARWLETRSSGKHIDHELRMRRADGQYRWFLTRAMPLHDERGNIVRWYGTATDVEDFKRAEEARQQTQSDLAHVSRVTTMGELTASLAHEVNQPIAASLMNAGSCVRWLAADPPNLEEARAAASRIVEDGRRATEIVGRIRLLFMKGAPRREWVDVNDLIREMSVLLRSETTRYAISVRTELAADLPQVMGDRVQLQQVLMNLMMNSIDAMKHVTGIRDLAITSKRGDNGHLLVSVSDTGVGLPQQADHIFKAFFTTKDHGIGMGLSISRSIVESHGGHLWAADYASSGASFSLTLPTKI